MFLALRVLLTNSGRAGSTAPAQRLAGKAMPALLLLVASGFLLVGCATPPGGPVGSGRAFRFERDTFAYANELVWEYQYDSKGAWKTHRRQPKPDYALHCFVVARSARQFFDYARFAPSEPKAEEETYRKRIRAVVTTNPRKRIDDSRKIVIPGYPDLRSFSSAEEALLKQECGRALQSYFQRGNWRTIFPFTRPGQEKMAQRLARELEDHRLPIVHLVRFPDLKINHAMLLFAAEARPGEIVFSAYDPNDPAKPTALIYEQERRSFTLARNNYFQGGVVNVYEVYSGWDY